MKVNLPDEEKKYDLIVVDPPWPLKKLTRRCRPNQKRFDYKTLSMEDIEKLKISTLGKEKSMCLLWCTQKTLFDAKKILENWGFSHLLTMVWEKTYGRSSGMPLFGFRWNAEFILVGTTKKISLWPQQKLIPAVFQAPNIGHSIKPSKFYDLVSPLGERKIDIFARKKREGWDVWGDEVESSINFDIQKGLL